MIQLKDQPKHEAVPESATRFYLKSADGLVEFVKSQDGAVTGLEILDDNQKIKASLAPAPKAGAGEQTKAQRGWKALQGRRNREQSPRTGNPLHDVDPTLE